MDPTAHPTVLRPTRWGRWFGLGRRTRAFVLEADRLTVEADPGFAIALADCPPLAPPVRGVLWSSLTLETAGRTLTLRGLDPRRAADFHAALLESIRAAVAARRAASASKAEQIRQARALLPDLQAELDGFERLFAGRYCRHGDLAAWWEGARTRRAAFEERLAPARDDPEIRAALARYEAVLEARERVREARNAAFCAAETARFARFFDRVESRPLTPRQRLACVMDDGANVVLAGAGSGKTSVIVARAGYRVASARARPAEMLVLAYNRKASQETDRRIERRLPEARGITAQTFHALGLAIIGEATGSRPEVDRRDPHDRDETARFLEAAFRDRCATDPEYGRAAICYWIDYLKPHTPPETFSTRADYFAHLRQLAPRTLRGERTRSHEEARIADYLFANGIDYDYEPLYPHHAASATHRRYRPDFHLRDADLYLEHFALIDPAGRTPPFIPAARYGESIRWKRALHRRHGTTLLETYSYQFRDGTVWAVLERQLRARGVRFAPRPAGEVLDAAKPGTPASPSALARLCARFIALLKNAGQTPSRVRAAMAEASDAPRALAFMTVFEPLWDAYHVRLRERGTLDFEDMILQAAEHVERGRYRSPYREVLVDEFQDLSAARARLLRALLGQRPDASLFAVGDDWQSIYRFGGSDITFITAFNQHFGPADRVDLDLTFRFNSALCALSSAFITAHAGQIKKDVRSDAPADGPAVTVLRHREDEREAALTACLEDIARDARGEKRSVYLLGRFSAAWSATFEALSARHHLAVNFSTVHASKGLEADAVIVLDVADGRYGFPSQIEDDPLLRFALPPEEGCAFAEERRLFYVALTRARQRVYLLAPLANPSPFIAELWRDARAAVEWRWTERARAAWAASAPCPRCGVGRLLPQPDGRRLTCGNAPYCAHTAPACPRCGRPALAREDGWRRCAGDRCGFEAAACPACDDGLLIERQGPHGAFEGCSNYPDCRFSRSRRRRVAASRPTRTPDR